VKSAQEVTEILAAYDLTGSLRDAAELAGCSHHTVGRYVAAREEGRVPGDAPARRAGVIDPFLAKLEELVDRSRGKGRPDVAHEKITAMGYGGSGRTTQRAVARMKASYAAGRRRVFRPWVPGPGMWAQYDFGDGPRIGGTATILFLCVPRISSMVLTSRAGADRAAWTPWQVSGRSLGPKRSQVGLPRSPGPDPRECEVVDASAAGHGLTSLVRPGKSVTNQVTTHPIPCGRRRIQPDIACGLTCGDQTSRDLGRRIRPAWHARGQWFEPA
jgi:hypothetical protein